MLTITIGDNANFKITWQVAKKGIDITGCEMFFTMKTNVTDSDSSAVLSKTWSPVTFTDTTVVPNVIYDTLQGMTLLTLLNADTSGLTAGTYYWNIRMKSVSGIVTSTNNASLLVQQGITQRVS